MQKLATACALGDLRFPPVIGDIVGDYMVSLDWEESSIRLLL
jgi:hypothetical protein